MKILIVDNSEIFRLGLAKLVEDLYSDISITYSDTKRIIADHGNWKDMDLIILRNNHDKDEISGLLRRVKISENGLKVIVLSDRPNFYEARSMFELGIKGYSASTTNISNLNEAVRSVLLGKLYVETSLLIDSFKGDSYSSKTFRQNVKKVVSSRIELLSEKEFEIATYLIKGFKTNEISGLLNKKASTISTQKSRIYQKLRVNNLVELLDCMTMKPGNDVVKIKNGINFYGIDKANHRLQ